MKKKSVFWPVYFICIGLFALALVFGLRFVNVWAAEYESVQPENIVQAQVVDKLQTGDLPNLTVSQYENRDLIAATLQELTAGKALTVSSIAKTDGTCDAAYAVKADDTRIMQVYLTKNAEKERYGNIGYSVSKITLDQGLMKEATVYMPAEATVTINGEPLDEEARVSMALPTIEGKTLPDNLNPHQYAIIGNLLSTDLTVAATDDSGHTLNVVHDGDTYTVEQYLDSAESDAVGSFALKACKAYAAYMQDDSYLGAVSPYMDTTTTFYYNLKTTPVSFAWDHDSYDFTDSSVTDVYKYSDGLYSCRVKFTQVLNLKDRVYKEYFDKVVYVSHSGSSYLVLDVQTPEAS